MSRLLSMSHKHRLHLLAVGLQERVHQQVSEMGTPHGFFLHQQADILQAGQGVLVYREVWRANCDLTLFGALYHSAVV